MNPFTKESFDKKRFKFIIIILVVFTILIISRLFSLTVLKDASRRSAGKTDAIRGTIYDRHGNVLAVSKEVYSVYFSRDRFKVPNDDKELMKDELNRIIEHLSDILKLSQDEILEKISRKDKWLLITRKIDKEKAMAIKELKLAGIVLETEYKRFYPHNDLCSHLLGFAGDGDIGLEGIEYYFNDILKPKYQNQTSISYGGQFGYNLYLTIDKYIQTIVEEQLEKHVALNKAESGSAVILEASTGEVLAMANFPKYDLNRFSEYANNPEIYRNKIVTDIYEPGSVLKIFSALSLYDSGTVSDSDVFISDGPVKIKNHIIKNSNNSYHHSVTLQEIIKYSDNVGMTKALSNIDDELFHKYLLSFGFGEKTGIPLPGESSGLIKSPSEFTSISKFMIGIGHEIAVTPIQLVTAFTTILNDGYLKKPRLISKLTNEFDDVIEELDTENIVGEKVIKKQTAEAITDYLKEVVKPGGTGERAYNENIEVAGKTGTAQIFDFKKGEYSDTVNTSFIGIVPTQDSNLIMLVVVRKPKYNLTSSRVAAPLFRDITQELLNSGILLDY